ncbi:MAG: xanthine dehydrogenase family protein molybdopterin-binding subunit [Rhodospirillaceae bacterium]|nr:MAG: xanthine dehydrogenase family protein molybdopterin-binding subunit [Rhodospirillaceae bacterium]
MNDLTPISDKVVLDRRGFLVGSIATIGLVAGFGRMPSAEAEVILPGAEDFAPNLWFSMTPDMTTTVYITKAEMGQHVGTPLAQALAEELDVPWEHVRIEHVDSAPKWGLMITGGSTSVNTTFDTMSRAGAAGRMALIKAAAKHWQVAESECSAAGGTVKHSSGKSIGYGELIAQGHIGNAIGESDWAAIKLKDPADYKIVGKPTPALDIPPKTNGTARYGIDVFLPGMLYGKPIVPPTRTGSTVTAIDDSGAKGIKGYVKAVKIDDPSKHFDGWVVVTADNYYAASQAADAIKVSYDTGPNAQASTQTIFDAAKKLSDDPKSGVDSVNEGQADALLAKEQDKLDVVYTTDPNFHATMEPVNATAVLINDTCHIYTGSQFQTSGMQMVGAALGIDPANVIVHQQFLGGGFGRRLYSDYMIPAALTAKAMGRPVKLIYSRADDFAFDCARAPSYQAMQGSLDANGRLAAVHHDVVAGWPMALIAPFFMSTGVDGKSKFDDSALDGADFWYSLPNHHLRGIENEHSQKVLPPGWLRAVGPGFTTWAVESFIDEMADKAKADPLDFRLKHLDGAGRQGGGDTPSNRGGAKRLAAVLQTTVERSGYGKKTLPADTAIGLAVSAGQSHAVPTFAACAAEVSVNRQTGDITVHKITQVLDAGQPINPDGIISQMEGATLWGVSIALYEQGQFENGKVQHENFDSYTPLRMSQVPELDVSYVADSKDFPVGLGEPPLNAVAPAIANAIHRAVGARVRSLPITADKVKAAMNA